MMLRQKEIIARRLAQLEKMRGHLAYSDQRMRAAGIADKDMGALSDTDAEILAAFRTRFSEYQEHIGKLLKAIAIEEGAVIVGMSDVVSFAEKAGIVEGERDWKEPRDIRNAINHDYEENAQALSILVRETLNLVDQLMRIHQRAVSCCRERLGIAVPPAPTFGREGPP